MFKFNQPFEIQEDGEVLKKLGLSLGLDKGRVELNSVDKIKNFLPSALRDYVDRKYLNKNFPGIIYELKLSIDFSVIINNELEDKFIPLPFQTKRPPQINRVQ